MKRSILLLAAMTAVLMFSVPGFAQTTYTWHLKCGGAAATGAAGTGVTWVWLHNGVQISYNSGPPNGSAACLTGLSGSGEVPASINGIQVNGINVSLSLSEYPAGCDAFASVTKSFDPSNPKFSIGASVSAPAKNFWGTACPKASFHFGMAG